MRTTNKEHYKNQKTNSNKTQTEIKTTFKENLNDLQIFLVEVEKLFHQCPTRITK